MMEILSVVALLKDVPEQGLVRGQVGTVVEKLSSTVFEIEFVDDEGHTYAMVEAEAESLLALHYEQIPQVAMI